MRAVYLVIAALIIAVAAWFGYQYWPRDDAETPVAGAPNEPAAKPAPQAETKPSGPAAPSADQMARRRNLPAAGADKEPAAEPAPAKAPTTAPTTARTTATRETQPNQPTAAVTPDRAEPKAAPPAPVPPAAIQPSFDVVRVGNDCTAVIAGRAAPDAVVTVLAGGAPIGQVTASRRGEWVLLLDRPLPSGPRKLSLSAAGADGRALPARQDVVLVVPDCARPEPDRGPAIALLEPKQGAAAEAPTKVLQAPPPTGAKQKDLNVGAVDYDESGKVALTGKAAPGAQVQAYVNNQLVGKAAAEKDGSWRVTPDDTVKPGVHELRIDQVDDKGKVTARVVLPFNRAAPGELKLSADHVVVQPGNSLWRIARRSYGHGLLYTVIYEANREQIRDPDLIYPGQVFVLPSGEKVPIN